MNPMESILSDHQFDLARATHLLCDQIDVFGPPAFWSNMFDASELLVGLAHGRDDLRNIVVAHVHAQFNGVISLAGSGSSTQVPSNFVDAFRVLLETAALVSLKGWYSAADLSRLFVAACKVVGSRTYATEKFLTRFSLCYTECDDDRQASAALDVILKDGELLDRIEDDPMAVNTILSSSALLRVAPPRMRAMRYLDTTPEQRRAEGSPLVERRRSAVRRVAALTGRASR